jgi:hypothetical protein
MRPPETQPINSDFRCALWWGRDPQIRLTGIANVLAVDSVVIRVEDGDVRLLPEAGRKVRIEIEWLPIGSNGGKRLVCNGVVERIGEAIDGSTAIRCNVRSGRFQDATKAAGAAAAVPGWRM